MAAGVKTTPVCEPDAPAETDRSPGPLQAYAWSRLLTLVVAVLGGARVGVSVIGFLNRWDAGWWILTARQGYPAVVPTAGGTVAKSTLAFFPLFPGLIRATTFLLPVSAATAGILVSVAAGAVSVVLIHRIALRLTTPLAARRAAVLFSFFPGAMVLSMPYSEGVMIALCAACLLALMEERWTAAGLWGLLATASRASALAVVPACLWHAVRAARRDGSWRPLAAPALAPIGALAFVGFLWARTGDAVALLHAEKAWGTTPGFARATRILLADFVRAPFTDPLAATVTLSVLVAAGAGVMLLRRRWPVCLSLYTLSVLAISAASRTDGLRPRDVLTAFPLFLAVGDGLPGRWYRPVVGLLAAALAVSLLFHNIGFWGQP